MTEREMLEAGLRRLGYHPQDVDNFLAFSARLLETNKVMNLTAVTEPAAVVKRHFLDCAAALSLLELDGRRVLDVGCGAGFPGMPAALLFPTARVTLLDSLGKRIHFLQEAIAALGVDNAQAVQARAEEYAAAHRAQYDVVTSRAVARMNVLCELSLPLVKVGGVFAAMKSVSSDEELHEAAHAIEVLGGMPAQVREYMVPFADMRQRLIVVRKARETPGKYPRRYGKITAAPL